MLGRQISSERQGGDAPPSDFKRPLALVETVASFRAKDGLRGLNNSSRRKKTSAHHFMAWSFEKIPLRGVNETDHQFPKS